MSNYFKHKRAVYNMIMNEAFEKMYDSVVGENVSPGIKATSMSIFNEAYELSTDNKSIDEIHNQFETGGSYQLANASRIALAIANESAEDYKKAGSQYPDDDKIEIADYEKDVIETILNKSEDDDVVGQIQDKVAVALMEEKKRSEELKEVVSLAKSEAADDKAEEEVINECIIDKPQSLMHAMMNGVASIYLANNRETIMNENLNIGDFFEANKEAIQDDACDLYAAFETFRGHGWGELNESMIRKHMRDIYNIKPE